MQGLVLLYVGAVLFINGLTMLGRIAPREAAIMNLFTGGLALFAGLLGAASGQGAQIRAAAFGLLFAFTYLWSAYATLTGQDGRGLGWFSLFVAVTAAWVTFDEFARAQSPVDYALAACWAAWVPLWLGFFGIGALRRTAWTRPVAWLALVQAVLTAWLPGYLMLSGRI
ncbi:MAG: transporter [Comamonadaceae bacterium]|jgi:hypothetical protein|nr:transporter [Comamonadaceae bacterium]